MASNASLIKELRKSTAAPVLDCKKAIENSNGNIDKAIEWLRENGLSRVVRKSGRAANEGIVDTYIHHGNRVGVMAEVNCETDFVARSEEFRGLVHDLLLHIAMANPDYVDVDAISKDTVAKAKARFRQMALGEGKPEHIADKIVEGRLENFFKEVCLLRQPIIKDEDIPVRDVINHVIAKVGENIVVQRFVRYELGT